MSKILRPSGVVIHHSATPDQGVLDYPAILNYHTKVNGWNDVGYHALVEVTEYGIVCIYGRPVTRYGAHTRGHNDKLGICFIGTYNHVPPPRRVLDEAMHRVIIPWCHRWGFTAAQVRGHREFEGVNKTCPGRAFNMDLFRARIREALS